MNASLDSDLLEKKPKIKWTELDKVGLYMAGISFVVGTVILLTFLITKKGPIISVGMGYLGIAFIVNLIFFLVLLVNFAITRAQVRSHLKTAGIMLLNIPIAYGYFVIVAMSN